MKRIWNATSHVTYIKTVPKKSRVWMIWDAAVFYNESCQVSMFQLFKIVSTKRNADNSDPFFLRCFKTRQGCLITVFTRSIIFPYGNASRQFYLIYSLFKHLLLTFDLFLCDELVYLVLLFILNSFLRISFSRQWNRVHIPKFITRVV